MISKREDLNECVMKRGQGSGAPLLGRVYRPAGSFHEEELPAPAQNPGLSGRLLGGLAGRGLSNADESCPNPAGKALPNPGLIYWLALHGHGIGRMTGDDLQMATPTLRQRQAAPVLDGLRPLGVFRHGFLLKWQ